ncbi:MAG: methyltransferase domain-containing protein [Rhodanobacteraceae bacterium]
MAQFHFVEDYEALVASLIKQHPIDEAMSLAVGGAYRPIGEIEYDVLRYAGLNDGMTLVDIGCGSGRLAHVLGEKMEIHYLGTDIVQSLLDYAKTKCPAGYKFKLHRKLSVPISRASADMICAFSVFTHLLHEESYVYLEEMKTALRAGGRVVFSFLEFSPASDLHWHVFDRTVEALRHGLQERHPLNTFIERSTIEAWCRHLGYEIVEFVDGGAAPFGNAPLGQSMVILQNS